MTNHWGPRSSPQWLSPGHLVTHPKPQDDGRASQAGAPTYSTSQGPTPGQSVPPAPLNVTSVSQTDDDHEWPLPGASSRKRRRSPQATEKDDESTPGSLPVQTAVLRSVGKKEVDEFTGKEIRDAIEHAGIHVQADYTVHRNEKANVLFVTTRDPNTTEKLTTNKEIRKGGEDNTFKPYKAPRADSEGGNTCVRPCKALAGNECRGVVYLRGQGNEVSPAQLLEDIVCRTRVDTCPVFDRPGELPETGGGGEEGYGQHKTKRPPGPRWKAGKQENEGKREQARRRRAIRRQALPIRVPSCAHEGIPTPDSRAFWEELVFLTIVGILTRTRTVLHPSTLTGGLGLLGGLRAFQVTENVRNSQPAMTRRRHESAAFSVTSGGVCVNGAANLPEVTQHNEKETNRCTVLPGCPSSKAGSSDPPTLVVVRRSELAVGVRVQTCGSSFPHASAAPVWPGLAVSAGSDPNLAGGMLPGLPWARPARTALSFLPGPMRRAARSSSSLAGWPPLAPRSACRNGPTGLPLEGLIARFSTPPRFSTSQRSNNRPDWRSQPEYESWLLPVDDDATAARCTLCASTYTVKFDGVSTVKHHASTQKHKQKSLASKQSAALTKFFAPATSSAEDKVTAAELGTIFHGIKHNYSYLSMDCGSKLAPKVFPNSDVACRMRVGRTKMEHLVKDVLAPYAKLRPASRNLPFALSTDASNKGNRKLFPIAVRFYDVNDAGITDALIDFCEQADDTSGGICELLATSLEKCNRLRAGGAKNTDDKRAVVRLFLHRQP
ncbi:hypothetical protein HPB47_008382 [Ixodes persulcatus]|uniref:Uncharacterized protein n=1 Tax=Ixodes persulcatus TaxID=34615 RepID=A0AC60P4W1_IXOPE|nr:hypothetical protein HPB47_008382 [Ixodes persulcatus]